MEEQATGLPSGFFGLNKRNVDQYLRQLQRALDAERDVLVSELKDAQREQYELRAELDALQTILRARQNLQNEHMDNVTTPEGVSNPPDVTVPPIVQEPVSYEPEPSDWKVEIAASSILVPKSEEVLVEEVLVEEVSVEEVSVEEVSVEEVSLEEAPVEEAPVEEAPVEEVSLEAASGFWGSTSKFLREDGVDLYSLLSELVADGTHIPRGKSIGVSAPKSSTLVAENRLLQEHTLTNESNTSSIVPTQSRPSQPTSRLVQKSENAQVYQTRVISEEIAHLRTKYIVGKLAGGDLYSYQGQLIVAKGETISEEVIQAAHNDGKLAELIVNMVIPETGETLS